MYWITHKLGSSYDTSHLYEVSVLVDGLTLRTFLQEPWNTPSGATPIPAGFRLKEHTHQQGLPRLLPGVVSTTVDGGWTVNDGDTLTLELDGAQHTATVQPGDVANSSDATSDELAAVVNRDIAGVTAYKHPHVGSSHLVIVSDDPDVTLQITGGLIQAQVAFPTSLMYGDLNGANQPLYHASEADDAVYLVDIVDPNQTHQDLAPTLRSWEAALHP